MILRKKDTGEICASSGFNTFGLTEIIVYADDWADSCYIKDFEVQLKSGEWKDMAKAFNDKDLIPDNYNVNFKEASSEQERTLGYY